MSVRRRALLGNIGAVSLAACAIGRAPLAGVIALPERSLTYAPLLAAVKAGLYRDPPPRLALMQRDGGARVAGAVAGGFADAGALSLSDFLRSVDAGAPLIAVGALTRRLACQLVVANGVVAPRRTLASLASGDWRGVRVGVETGSDGTEALARFLLLTRETRQTGGNRSVALESVHDPVAGEPRWIEHPTGEALVAALADGRIDAFLGRPYATAHAMTLGGTVMVGNLASGEQFGEISRAFCTVLVAHRDRLQSGARTAELLTMLVPACAQAAVHLSGTEGAALATRLFPERDGLAVHLATQLSSPPPATSSYATDGRVPLGAVESYVELTALAGNPLTVDSRSLVAERYSG
jgi:ABC-type nitrate/sulfonate/bicarbonate transport system substrate-binding protein